MPECQGLGLGRLLIESSLKVLPNQWGEILLGDTQQRQRYLSIGFQVLSDRQQLERLLGPLLVPLVLSYRETSEGLVYTRQTFSTPRRTREFVAMIHGRPMDRVKNNGTIYLID